MIVLKFGGTSVSTAKNIKTISEITHRIIKKKPVIVVSALSGTTDLLLSLFDGSNREQALQQIKERHISLVKDLWNGEYPEALNSYIDSCLQEVEEVIKMKKEPKEKNDIIVSYGEKMSSYLISYALRSFGINAQQALATDFIVTNNDFGSADFILHETVKKTKKVLLPLLDKGIVPIVTGFIGSTTDGRITTLGRGGSDYSASIIGLALKVEEVQIWTDVDGVFTSDPRVIRQSYQIKKISYREAAELAAFGAKVLHPRTIRPAQSAQIPVRVLNTMNPKNPGTLIEIASPSKSRIVAVTAKKNITLVNIYSADMFLQKGFLSKVFAVFAEHNISVDLVSVSEVSVSVTLDNEDNLKKVTAALSKFTSVTTTSNVGIVSIIGEKIVGVRQIMNRIFEVLDKKNIVPKMISFGATDINISLVVGSLEVEKAVKSLHNSLLLKK